MNRLPPIQLQFDDTNDEKNKGQNSLLSPFNTFGSMTDPLPGSGTPRKPIARSRFDSGRWIVLLQMDSKLHRRHLLSSPSLFHSISDHDPSHGLPNVTHHHLHPQMTSPTATRMRYPSSQSTYPCRKNAFSPPFWDATQRT